MRNRYVIAYDISSPKRLAKVFRKMKGFGDPLQLSVFQCDLSRQELVAVKACLLEIINEREDRVIIIDTGPSEGRGGRSFEFLGRKDAAPEEGPVVV